MLESEHPLIGGKTFFYQQQRILPDSMEETWSILHYKDRLQEQLQKAKESLRGVDDNLKKFISRNVSDTSLRPTFNKASQINDSWKNNKDDNNFNRRRPAKNLNDADIENIPIKKRLGPKVLHSSISGPPKRTEDGGGGGGGGIDNNTLKKKPVLSSCVIAKPHALPSRKDALSVKTYTETRARDRRMFGALLGTLQKFRQEETQLKDKEDKKAQVEKKLEEAAKREKEKLRLERQKLMDIRKQRESYIRAVENNMKLVKEQEYWEELQRPLFNYIKTETSPTLCYLPKILDEKTTALLKQCQDRLTELIEEKRESVKEEVDTLISQWQNADMEEYVGKSSDETSPPRSTHTAAAATAPADYASDRVACETSESQIRSSVVVSNGSWSSNSVNQLSDSLRNGESGSLYSAKEQRIRKTFDKTDEISVKKEKEDDYDLPVSIKEEKSTTAAAAAATAATATATATATTTATTTAAAAAAAIAAASPSPSSSSSSSSTIVEREIEEEEEDYGNGNNENIENRRENSENEFETTETNQIRRFVSNGEENESTINKSSARSIRDG